MASTRLSTLALGSLVTALSLPAPANAYDSLIAQMANQVERGEVEAIISHLESYGTRYSFTAECDAAAGWLEAELVRHGVSVAIEEFLVSGETLRNVIGRHEGSLHPERVVIVGAHYDSTSNDQWNLAPGADDNASGVAAVLEAARILSAHEFENTIEFLLFGGEEQGRTGSLENAANARAAGKEILGVVNLDMIGYWPPSHDQELDIGKNDPSSWLADVLERATRDYASIVPRNWPDTGVCYDDHVSYWGEGYDAIILMDCYEAHADPIGSGERTIHYHRTSDTIDTLDLDLTTEAVRATVSGMAELAVPLIAPMTLYAVDSPIDDVALSWSGGAPQFDVDRATRKDFSLGRERLTPADGIADPSWLDAGVLADGVLYFYRVDRH